MAKANSDVQGEIDGLKSTVELITADLDCAEGCETHADLIANLEAALENLALAEKQIKEVLRDAKTSGPDEDD